MTEWSFRSRSRSCHKCGAEFADGGVCRSAVAFFVEPLVREIFAEKIAAQAAERAKDAKNTPKDPEYVRLDFCEACWDAMSGATSPPDFISAWRSVYSAPEPESVEPLPKETAESLLRRMLEHGGDEATPAVIFVLAVMLERKRILLERSVRRNPDGTLTRVYEHRKTGEIMLIPDPNLSVDEIPDAQQQIDRLLG